MSKIIRGTTPSISFHITSEVDLSTFTEIWFTIADSQTTAERTFKLSDNEVSVDSEASMLIVTLSQEDTLSFKSKMVRVQIRALDENDLSYATDIYDVPLAEILKGGVIADE